LQKKCKKIAKNSKKIAKKLQKIVEKMAFRRGRRSAVGDIPPWATFCRATFCRATFSRGTKNSPNLVTLVVRTIPMQGCQIFLGATHQNGGKYTKLPQNIPKGHPIYQMSVKHNRCPLNIPTSCISRP
jgi:hypothetical protein